MIEKRLGIIEGIFIAPPEHKGFPRPSCDELRLIENYGIDGDKFAGADPNKALLVVGRETYNIAKEHGIELKGGSFGENIIFDFDPHTLKIGTRIKIGDAEIEVVEKCTTCHHLSVFGDELPKIVKGRRGVYCKINRSGTVSTDSNLFELLPQEEIYMMDKESKKLYACVSRYPNNLIRLKTVLLLKNFNTQEELDAEIARLEGAPNIMDALDSYAEYPDFVLSGFIKTENGKIVKMGGVASEIEFTFPSSNGSYLQIVAERLKSIAKDELYLCCAIDVIEASLEKSAAIDDVEASSSVPSNAMMDELEWAIYEKSLSESEYESGAWNMGIFVLKKEKQLAKVLGFYP